MGTASFALGLVLTLASPPSEVLRIDPGTESVALARAMRYLRDRSLELDAATAVRKARAGEFQPLPRGRPVFGFQRGAFWFFLRIENADPWEPRVRGAAAALPMTDLDHFEQIDDRHGHLVGEGCLLPGLDGGAAERVGEQIRRTVASRRAECHGVSLALTLSMGIGELSAEGAHASPAALVRAADAALYRAKAEGRDRVCRHPVPVA